MESSLDLFARTRGATMVGLSSVKRQWKIQVALGGAFLAVGGFLATLPLLGTSPEILAAALGPAIAGGINLGFGLYGRKKVREEGIETLLSDEAADLLRALVVRAQAWQGRRLSPHPALNQSYRRANSCPATPPSFDVMAALERAAAAHNRIMATLGNGKDERSTRLRLAADAGIGEALHYAATQPQVVPPVGETADRLEELAALVENTDRHPDAVSVLRSNLQTTIDDLKAEAEAVRELRS